MRFEPRVVTPALALCLALVLPIRSAAQTGKETPVQNAPGPATAAGSPQFQPRIAGYVAVGERAPEFELDGSGGKPVQLSTYRGRWVLLVFGDRKETVAPMREVAAALDSSSIALLGICNEKAYFLEAFARQSHFPFPLLADVTREISAMYGLDDPHERFIQPGFIMIEPRGDVRFALLGQTIPAGDVARLARYVASRP